MFRRFKKRFQGLGKDERGLEGIEYLLIAALVIIAAIGAWKFLGSVLSNKVNKMANTIDETVDESIEKGTGKK
ncbi:MAG: Flp family type IVb pilin [Planctomycetota bacterium]|nr:Flp family type IVb pilin [Planctomycetota bacterium]